MRPSFVPQCSSIYRDAWELRLFCGSDKVQIDCRAFKAEPALLNCTRVCKFDAIFRSQLHKLKFVHIGRTAFAGKIDFLESA